MSLEVPFVLETEERLSKSLLWAVQRRFFAQTGMAAFRDHTVPHYVTSNPFIAGAYAKVVFGWLRDCAAASAPLDPGEPIHIIELGGGSGRFAFLFLQRFLELHAGSRLRHLPVRYLLTDFADSNLAALSQHPSLRPFLEAGTLALARFDFEDEEAGLVPFSSGAALPAPRNPMAVIANYVFDSIPQDVFSVRAGKLHEGLVTVTSEQPEPLLDDPELLKRIRLSWTHHPIEPGYYGDEDLDRILAHYQARLGDSTFLFPCAAIQGLRRLAHMAGGRLLLLTGDKGQIREDALLAGTAPSLVVHGSFSLMVNYHAIMEYVRARGGETLATSHRHSSLGIYAFVLDRPGESHDELRLAFDDAIERGGPDDFFTGRQPGDPAGSLPQILALIRLSGWDPRVMQGFLPALIQAVEGASQLAKEELWLSIQRVWDAYFPIGEERDLAFALGTLLCAIGFFPEAIELLTKSVDQYGPDPSTLYNLAQAHFGLRQLEDAAAWIEEALHLAPDFAEARSLRLRIESAR